MRTIGGIILGLVLFYPGTELVRWLYVQVFGFCDSMTLTDCCLFMVMLLLCVHLVRGRPAAAGERRRSAPRERNEYEEPQLQFLPSERPKTSRRPAAAKRTRRLTRRSGDER